MHRRFVQIMCGLCIDYACSIPYIFYAQRIMHNLCIVYTYFFYMGPTCATCTISRMEIINVGNHKKP